MSRRTQAVSDERWVSPTGATITGTLERLSGEALITGIHPDGTPEYYGETEVWWDDATTVTRDGKIIYLDENGAEWTFDQLKRVKGEEEEVE